MKNLIYFIKLFLPLYGLLTIYLEERRKHNSINKYFLLLFYVIFLKEVFSYILLTIVKYPQVYIERFILFHYIFYSIYIFAFTYIILDLIIENRKIVKLYFYLWILVFGGIISIILLRLEFTNIFEIILRIIFIGGISFTLFKLATTYFGEEELNIITKNRFIINTTLIITMFLIIFFHKSLGIFKNLMEIIVYILLVILNYYHIKEGYIELESNIKHLEYEQDILLELLSRVGSALSAESNFDEVLRTIIEYSVEVLNARAAAILTISQNKKYLIPRYVKGLYPPVEKVEGYVTTRDRFLVERFKAEKISIGESYLGEVAKTGVPLLIQDAINDPRIIQSAKGLMDIRTVIVVPLKFRGEVVGVMSFLNKEAGGSFTQEEFKLAQTLAEQAAVTLNNFRLYNELLAKQREERELEIAGEIQKQLLPKRYPKIEKIELFGFSKSARSVGGDYYDFLNFGNKRLGIIMADVAGKGIPAALVMVMIRSILRAVARHNILPIQIVTFLNKMITGEVPQERYATLFYYLLDLPTNKLYYTNAAHLPLLVYRKSQEKFEILDTPGLPIGITKEQKYMQGETVLSPGDIAVLYTDGITEARNIKKEEFTIERLQTIIKENAEKSVQEIGANLKDALDEFVGEAPPHDDQTIVILKIK